MDAPLHGWDFRFRRFLNWFPLGLAYAFMYMGRYNLTVAKAALGQDLSKSDFGDISSIGNWVYGLSFLLTGPLVDKIGGRAGMLIGTAGTIAANFLMGLLLYANAHLGFNADIKPWFILLYALNMHFQSYGAISIVTVKAPWFHVRERGRFSTIFGVMISLGVYFAFDWGFAIMAATRDTVGSDLSWFAALFRSLFETGGTGVNQNWWLFFMPALILSALWVIMYLWLCNTPKEAGHRDFDTGEDTLSVSGQREPMRTVFLKILRHPVLRWVCIVEFCSGIIRNGVMHWYPLFGKEVGFYKEFLVTANWGACLLVCGVLGAVLTGWASDRFFQSRRAPMAALLYGGILAAAFVMFLTIASPQYWFAGAMVLTISMAVIGVHGIFSGTATADFAGVRNAGVATGVVDGIVYLGSGLQFLIIGHITPTGEAAKVAANWSVWPIMLIPFALVGIICAGRIWNAIPKRHK